MVVSVPNLGIFGLKGLYIRTKMLECVKIPRMGDISTDQIVDRDDETLVFIAPTLDPFVLTTRNNPPFRSDYVNTPTTRTV